MRSNLMQPNPRKIHRPGRKVIAPGASLPVLLFAGCGSKGADVNANNPGTAGGSSSSQYNTYIGTHSVQPS